MQYYTTMISEHMGDTPEGYLICYDVPINRTGGQEYLPHEIGIDGNTAVMVERLPEDVFSSETLASFEGKPITNGHPQDAVNVDNCKALSMGHVQNVRRDGDRTIADLIIQDRTLIDLIKSGQAREISCGYKCDFVEEDGRILQKNIRGNHIAVVPQGRAGGSVAIRDSKTKKKESKKVEKKKSIFKALADMFDAMPQGLEEAEQEETVDEMVEKAPKGDDLGSKLDMILERLAALENKNEREEARLSDEKTLDEYLGESPDEETERIRIIKKMRPVIAEIPDNALKAKITDALLDACKTGGVKDVMTGLEKNAREMKDGYATDTNKILEVQKAEYDARNPHKKKEG